MAGFASYLGAAFNARPAGMPIPPNWIGLAAVALVGWFVHPGLWLVGAGLEIGYLAALVGNARFRAAIDGADRPTAADDPRRRLLDALETADRELQADLEARCRAILDTAVTADAIADPLRAQQAQQLAQLCWLHLRLLAARAAVRVVVRTGGSERRELERRLADLERRRDQADGDLAGSIEGQAAIVRSRLAQFAEAGSRLAYLDAELERLRQQTDLLREQALLAAGGSGGDGISSNIRNLGESLETTNRWMRDQRLTDDLAWEQAPPLPDSPRRAPGIGG